MPQATESYWPPINSFFTNTFPVIPYKFHTHPGILHQCQIWRDLVQAYQTTLCWLCQFSDNSLIPVLTCFDLHRQNEGWAPATYVKFDGQSYNLTSNFTKITEATIINIAQTCWTSDTIDIDKHTVRHNTYISRLLTIVLLGSLTEDIFTTILHRTPPHFAQWGDLNPMDHVQQYIL